MTTMIDPSFRYSQADHEHYLRAGYCFFECFLSAAGLAFGRRQIDRMVAQLQPGRSPEHMISCHQQEQWLFELACEPQILDLVERQIGPDIVLWSSHFLIKPPRARRYRPGPQHQLIPLADDFCVGPHFAANRLVAHLFRNRDAVCFGLTVGMIGANADVKAIAVL